MCENCGEWFHKECVKTAPSCLEKEGGAVVVLFKL